MQVRSAHFLFVFLEDLSVENVVHRGIRLEHAAMGIHRTRVERIRPLLGVAAIGMELVQTFGRGWGSVHVRDVDGFMYGEL